MKRTMRIAHITATFPPYYAGTGNVCYYNARELARQGHEVAVFTARAPDHRDGTVPGVAVHRLATPLRLGNAPLLPGLLAVSGFDLLHLHLPFIFGAELVWLNRRLRRLPYVVTYHNDLSGYSYRRPLFWCYQKWLTPSVLLGAARLLVTTLDYAVTSQIAPLVGRLGSKVTEMPNGVDADRFRPGIDSGGLRRRYGLADGEQVVLFVGALDRAHTFKGIDVLLQAMKKLSGRQAKLLIVGSGDLKDYYRRQAQQLGLDDAVIFCGRVPEEELPAHYSLSDCLVLPSTTMGEAFGVVLLEAMACGKPVVASNLPGVRTVVTDGVDGFLVTPGSVEDLRANIEALLEAPARRLEMGQRGRAKVEERFAWSKIGCRLEQVYREVLSTK